MFLCFVIVFLRLRASYFARDNFIYFWGRTSSRRWEQRSVSTCIYQNPRVFSSKFYFLSQYLTTLPSWKRRCWHLASVIFISSFQVSLDLLLAKLRRSTRTIADCYYPIRREHAHSECFHVRLLPEWCAEAMLLSNILLKTAGSNNLRLIVLCYAFFQQEEFRDISLQLHDVLTWTLLASFHKALLSTFHCFVLHECHSSTVTRSLVLQYLAVV